MMTDSDIEKLLEWKSDVQVQLDLMQIALNEARHKLGWITNKLHQVLNQQIDVSKSTPQS